MRTSKPESVYQKLYRAKHHSIELRDELKIYYETEPGEIIRGFSEDGQPVLRYCSTRPIPARFGLICGDCLQCLRSSLDYLIWELVISNGEQPNHNNIFPICLTEEQFGHQLRRHRLRGVHDDVIKLVKELQPFGYHTPVEYPLAVLDDLANINKHRRVIFTDLVGAFSKPDLDILQVRLKIVETLATGDVLRQFSVWASLRFGESTVKGWEVSKTLDMLAQTVGDLVLPRFQHFFE